MSRRLALWAGVATFFLTSAMPVTAQAPSVARYVLPTGLRLLVRDDPNAQVVTVSLQVRSGSRYETPSTSGLSHFVQRVMIRGTAKRSARDIVEAAEDIGGSVDASGDVDYAEIRGGALAAHRDTLLELIAEVVLEPTFPPEEVERERRLITSQIQTRAETPFALALDTLNLQLYGPHPLAQSPLGTRVSVEGLGREDLVQHYRRVYRAQTMVLAVSGRVDHEGVRRRVERLFAHVPRGAMDESVWPAPGPASERRIVLDRPSQQAHVLVGFLGPGLGEADYASGKIMTAILGGGVAGRFFARLRDDRGLAYSLGMVNPTRRGPGSFVAHVATSDERADRAEAGMRDEIERFRNEEPTEAELARAKAYVLGNLAMDRRTNARHAWYLAFFELAGVGWEYPDRYARALEAVTIADVTRVARRYLGPPTTVVVRTRS
jgi:predicted Zn-dependent peptidase